MDHTEIEKHIKTGFFFLGSLLLFAFYLTFHGDIWFYAGIALFVVFFNQLIGWHHLFNSITYVYTTTPKALLKIWETLVTVQEAIVTLWSKLVDIFEIVISFLEKVIYVIGMGLKFLLAIVIIYFIYILFSR